MGGISACYRVGQHAGAQFPADAMARVDRLYVHGRSLPGRPLPCRPALTKRISNGTWAAPELAAYVGCEVPTSLQNIPAKYLGFV